MGDDRASRGRSSAPGLIDAPLLIIDALSPWLSSPTGLAGGQRRCMAAPGIMPPLAQPVRGGQVELSVAGEEYKAEGPVCSSRGQESYHLEAPAESGEGARHRPSPSLALGE
jgi:hypothetical protein